MEKIGPGDRIEFVDGMTGEVITNGNGKYITYRCDFKYCPICGNGDLHRVYSQTLQKWYKEGFIDKTGD